MKNFFENSNFNNNFVLRGLNELRQSMPILIFNSNSYSLVLSSELLSNEMLINCKSFGKVNILLTRNRLFFLKENIHCNDDIYKFELNFNCTLNDISSLIGKSKFSNKSFIESINNREVELLDYDAMKMIKLSKLLPSAIVMNLEFSNQQEMEKWCANNNILNIDSNSIDAYQQKCDIYKVCQSRIFLKDCQNAEILVYRSKFDLLDYYAIIIGNPNYENPLIRIHSSCYTGDLLASLSCDCRNQLHSSIKTMNELEGGIILYLPQDGRGIGLTNKIRTYEMQIHNNMDTVDANRFFGFDDDERNFSVAAKILIELNIHQIKLLTNNPSKVNEMKKLGISVLNCIPLVSKCNQYNENYMKTKISRLGHFIN